MWLFQQSRLCARSFMYLTSNLQEPDPVRSSMQKRLKFREIKEIVQGNTLKPGFRLLPDSIFSHILIVFSFSLWWICIEYTICIHIIEFIEGLLYARHCCNSGEKKFLFSEAYILLCTRHWKVPRGKGMEPILGKLW